MKKQKSSFYISLTSLLVFILISLEVLIKGFIVNLDSSINQSIISIQSQALINASKILGVIFDTWSLLILAILVSLCLWFKDSRKDAIFFSLLMFIGAGIIFILKELIQRARPLNILINETNFSFPSGHATIAVIFFGILAYLILKRDHSKFERKISLVIAPIMILVIGFSRIYLNAHWFSDVLAGYFLGLFILAIGIWAYKKIQVRKI